MSRPWVRRIAVVPAAAWSIGALVVTRRSNPDFEPWLDFAVGVAYIAAGFIVWERQPRNRMGPLLTAAGVAWFSANYAADQPLLAWFGAAFGGAAVPVIMHAVFAYPTGRLHKGAERTLIAAGYTILATGAILLLLFVENLCNGCAQGPAPFPVAALESIVPPAIDAGFLAFSVAALTMLVRRFVRSTPARRLGLTELWIAGVTESLLVAFTAASFLLSRPFSAPLFNALSAAKLLIPASLLVGLLRLELARASVGALVVDLDPTAESADIRAALARALHDPSVTILFWLPDRNTFVDGAGNPASLPGSDNGRGVTMIERGGRRLAAIEHDAALADKPELIRSAGAATALALENARLHAEVRAQLEEVRASRVRLVETADATRMRIERDLHDGAQQRLLATSMALREARRISGDARAQQSLDEAIEDLHAAMAELRELARGVYPAILGEDGLGAALESLADRSAIETEVRLALPHRPPKAVETTAYFVASEALANVTKHAEATVIRIEAGMTPGLLTLCVSDDGRGGADPARGSGLRGLVDRVAALGGTFRVESEPDRGTRVTAEIPCD